MNEIELRKLLGIESWRNLSKETVLRFLESLPEVDREVALKLIAQFPEITKLVQAALDDAGKAYDAALKSNARSQEMVHEIHRGTLEALRAELDKDLTPEERMRVFDEIRDLNLNVRLKDTENKAFLAAQFDKRLAVAGGAFVTVIAIVLAAVRSGAKPTP
jgi:hypothetical protein